jgi:hypothetical protein
MALAACGGILAGSLAGCGPQPLPAKPGPAPADGPAPSPEAAKDPLLAGAWPPEGANLHACRGLNLCKGLGKGAANACAGQGACATAADHACGEANACKFQGGCGPDPGLNACKGQGGCAVPMEGDHWTGARKKFEKRLKAIGKPFGAAPMAVK